MNRLQLHKGDALQKLRTLPSNSFDGCLTDPPYGLSFMGAAWDKGVPSAELWREVFRVMKPGSFLLAFGGTRTYHRLVCAIEDAGFEIRDCLMWLYGSGFPKSHNISKALDNEAGAERMVVEKRWRTPSNKPGFATKWGFGAKTNGAFSVTAPATRNAKRFSGYGTALKPAWEPCIVAMKPPKGTFAQNAVAHGVAGLNIDRVRIGSHTGGWQGAAGFTNWSKNSCGLNKPGKERPVKGRFPANLILDETAGAALDAQSGNHGPRGYSEGGASRSFYCSKASTRERNAGLEQVPGIVHGTSNGAKAAIKRGTHYETSFGVNSTRVVKNNHPCVKPIDLNRYLAQLILPPAGRNPRRLLVPFSGSGSEIIGGLMAGWDEAVGIELNARYVRIARARVRHWMKHAKRGKSKVISCRPGLRRVATGRTRSRQYA